MARRRSQSIITRLEKIRRRVPLEATGQMGRVKAVIEREAKARVWPAKLINRQDSPSGRDRRQSILTPYAVTIAPDASGVTVKVTLETFYTGSRNAAVRSIMSSIGKGSLLVRKSLLVTLGSRRARASQRSGKVVRRSFSKMPRLQTWAERRDKGEQRFRHTVRLPKEALRRLVMVGTLKSAEPEAIAAWQAGVKRGFL